MHSLQEEEEVSVRIFFHVHFCSFVSCKVCLSFTFIGLEMAEID